MSELTTQQLRSDPKDEPCVRGPGQAEESVRTEAAQSPEEVSPPKTARGRVRKLVVLNLTGCTKTPADIQMFFGLIGGGGGLVTEVVSKIKINLALQLIIEEKGSIVGVIVIGEESLLLSEEVRLQIQEIVDQASSIPVFISTQTGDEEGFASYFRGEAVIPVGAAPLKAEIISRRLEGAQYLRESGQRS